MNDLIPPREQSVALERHDRLKRVEQLVHIWRLRADVAVQGSPYASTVRAMAAELERTLLGRQAGAQDATG